MLQESRGSDQAACECTGLRRECERGLHECLLVPVLMMPENKIEVKRK